MPTSYVDVHEAQTDVSLARPDEDQEQITPGERVALSVTGGDYFSPEATGVVKANGRRVGMLSPSPDEDNPVDTASAYFSRRSTDAVTITVGGETVDRLPSVAEEQPDAPGRQNAADPEPEQARSTGVDRTIDERPTAGADGQRDGAADGGEGGPAAGGAAGLALAALAALYLLR